MKILEKDDSMICNYELLKIIKERITDRKNENHGAKIPSNVATIEYETKKYLEGTCSNNYDDQLITRYLEGMMKWKLTKFEKLQILNLKSTSAADLLPIIEGIDERFSESQQQELLQDIGNLLKQN